MGAYPLVGIASTLVWRRFPAHSSKVDGRPASNRSAPAGGHPFSRRQRARMSFVELTNETDFQSIWPLRMAWRCTIHCSLSAASAHLPETANCVSAIADDRWALIDAASS